MNQFLATELILQHANINRVFCIAIRQLAIDWDEQRLTPS